MKLSLPDRCLVVLIGPAGSGKTTFARKHFRATQVLSSDAFRAMLGEGIYLAPSQYEATFISAAHTAADIDRTLEAAERALRRLAPGDGAT